MSTMSDTKRKRSRRSFTDEFKAGAVRLVLEEGKTVGAAVRETSICGSSVLVYQHYPRVERSRFVPFLADRLGEEIGAARVNAFATPHVVFLLAHQGVHEAACHRAVAAVQAAWHGQIDVRPSIPTAG